jgi:cell wall-associated NlpC family hydrolase
MKPGDVLFYKGASLIARIIAAVTRSSYTHVALAVGDGQIIEADRFIKTRIRTLQPDEQYDVYEFEGITDETREKLVTAALTLVDYPYDYRQIVRNFIRLVFKRNASFIEAQNAVICSDIIDVPAYIAGVKRNNVRPVGDCTPAELLEVYQLRPRTDRGLFR